jgi:hypothetical protein
MPVASYFHHIRRRTPVICHKVVYGVPHNGNAVIGQLLTSDRLEAAASKNQAREEQQIDVESIHLRGRLMSSKCGVLSINTKKSSTA